ncbi:SpoIIE family protein phosphatase [Actinocrinis puniceicyclus]|uniref:SpoIIE family protein phosphatase n=1 Tax=Actinocrinis puniceicyclus TaxID=977794 RepID=A0A8J7WG82_9ACTN|nr:SpoIIE family protein phosphatase [Actinocrinis puniceicyclus]MBS2961588.1 SpoIIE family protein phosphatase [Actinocrinis puniceicyclus]
MTPPQQLNATGEPEHREGGDEGCDAQRALAAWAHPGFAPSGFNASTGFYNWELATGAVVCDEQTFRLHGLAPDAEPQFETFLGQVPPQDLNELLSALQPLLSAAGDYVLEYRVLWPDGAVHTLETRGRVVPGPDGRPVRSMGVIADITERRAAEEAVRTEARAATRIQAVIAGLAAAYTMEEVRAAVEHALPALGADSLIIADAGARVQVLLACGAAAGTQSVLRASDGGPLRACVNYGSALFFPTSAELSERFAQVGSAIKDCGNEAWAFLPLSGIPRMRGVCVVGYQRDTRFDDAERTVLAAAASTIGQAVYRALVHDTEHTFALALQEGMLPHTLKFGPGVRGAWRYEAATTGIQVGGDWYDSVPLDDGSTLLIIGDVEGHNVHAAGMMYRLRTTVRTYAAEKLPLHEILRRAHEFVVEINDEVEYPIFATCLVVRVDPRSRTLTAGRAGHIPPVIVPPGPPAFVPQTDVGPPLGVPQDGRYPVRYPAWQMAYEPGTRLVLCTDGLLESLDKDLDEGLKRTLACLRDHGAVELEALADRLLSANRPRGLWKDDVAVLLAELD